MQSVRNDQKSHNHGHTMSLTVQRYNTNPFAREQDSQVMRFRKTITEIKDIT